MYIKQIIFMILFSLSMISITHGQNAIPYKTDIINSSLKKVSNNLPPSFNLEPNQYYNKNIKSSKDIWDEMSDSQKNKMKLRSISLLYRLLDTSRSQSRLFEPTSTFSHEQKGAYEIYDGTQTIGAAIFTLPQGYIHNIFRLDLDDPHVSHWDEKQEYTINWFNQLQQANIIEIKKGWENINDFFTDPPRCAFKLIKHAAKLSTEGNIKCKTTSIMWNLISSDNYPIPDECMNAINMIEYFNDTILRQVYISPIENINPTNPWKISKDEAIHNASVFLKEGFKNDSSSINYPEIITHSQKNILKIMWIVEHVDSDGIIQYIPRNTYSIIFGLDGKWPKKILPNLFIDATTGEILCSAATSVNRANRFIDFCNYLQTDKALIFN